jgi:hypothetical protein
MTTIIRGDQYDSSYYVWLQTLTEEQLSTLPPVYNGSFEQKLSGVPFDCLINAQAGVEAGIEHTEDKRMGRVLWLRFMGDRVQPKQVSQIVRSTPGTYRLSGNYRFRGTSIPAASPGRSSAWARMPQCSCIATS